MARQRFIWPELWKDPVFGKLQPAEQVMFIGLFSIADDDGRLLADPAYLRAELFAYKDYTAKKVKGIRDSVCEKCLNVHLYDADGTDYIALLKWAEYQRPKYPKPSKIPPPFLHDSPNLPPALPESGATGRAGLGGVGLGWEGMDRAGLEPADIDMEAKRVEVRKILRTIKGSDEHSEDVLLHLALQLPMSSIAKVRESCRANGSGPKYVGYAVNALKSEIAERAA